MANHRTGSRRRGFAAFANRSVAGQQLATALQRFAGPDVVVLGIPRGGVPVAAEVARALGAPLDVIIVRKIGVPSQPELAMGAIGEGGVEIANEDVLRHVHANRAQYLAVEERERAELDRRAIRYRGDRPRVPLAGRTAVIVDDGIATGATARAACQVARALGADRVVLAAPVAPLGAGEQFRGVADEVVLLETPADFTAVGLWYRDFSPTSDEEVITLLESAPAREPATGAHRRPVVLDTDGVQLQGDLVVPDRAIGLVVFAHGSGSSRRSHRNQAVAGVLQTAGVGTLLFDLLTPAEEADRVAVFDIALLGTRLAGVTRWLLAQPDLGSLPIGYFGASTGAAAAVWAAAEPDLPISALVSRGGRPDLAPDRLALVRAPTLLIVGGRDEAVIGLNREAAGQLRVHHELVVVPGATHVFPEPGTLDTVAELARDWFVDHLRHQGPAARPGADG